MKINLIFPIAGKSERFEGKFKPFLQIGDITFIEKTLSSFKRLDLIDKVYFICTVDQDNLYHVESTLKTIFSNLNVIVIKIPCQTSGPFQTLKSALSLENIKGKCIICDCDHYLETDELLTSLISENYDVVIPTYNITPDEYKNWSKVIFKDDKLIHIVEKEYVDESLYSFKGIIGCIGFKNIENLTQFSDFTYISEILNQLLLQGKLIKTIPINNCLFYGDPLMYENAVNALRKKCTIFCDIDGVLFKHSPHSTCDFDTNIVISEGDLQKLSQLQKEGHRIVLTSSRHTKYKDELIELLSKKNICYDDLVLDCNPGQRILINDRKPSKPFLPQANAFEVTRDKGIENFSLQVFNSESDTQITTQFKGNSFSQSYLISKGSKFAVRKHIFKNSTNHVHYEKLKRQYSDINRFYFLNKDLVPKPLHEYDSIYEYYYDIEYLDGYDVLSTFSIENQIIALKNLLITLIADVYSLKRYTDGSEWLKTFIVNKIESKLVNYRKIDPIFNYLITSETVKINDKTYLGLNSIFSKLNYTNLNPKFLCPIHGDLTLENIMYNEKDSKMIDMDGSDLFDVPEQDLGKLSQSLLSNYHTWNSIENPVDYSNNELKCTTEFFDVSNDEVYKEIEFIWKNILSKKCVYDNAIFYMCCYFIRFVPFRMQINKSHGYFALIMAIVWLNKLL
jgi:aminoglycoside phosphotransferase (APT) family kinase protein